MTPATHQVWPAIHHLCWTTIDCCISALFQVCPVCKMVCYCSNNCRVAGTAEHRLECLILTRSGNKRHSLSDHIRLIIRIWLRIRSEGVHRVERADTLSKCWDYLVDHTKALEVSLKIRKTQTLGVHLGRRWQQRNSGERVQ